MSIEEDLAKTVSNAVNKMGQAVDKLAKGIHTTLQKFKTDLNQAFIEQFIIYKDDNYVVMKNNSQIFYFKKLVDNELEKVDKKDVPDYIIEEVSKELL